jgi:hypothetical protein
MPATISATGLGRFTRCLTAAARRGAATAITLMISRLSKLTALIGGRQSGGEASP